MSFDKGFWMQVADWTVKFAIIVGTLYLAERARQRHELPPWRS